ncbi:MAG: BlaI/MecI/CopY family transcriptional regulator [Verrucomicrobiota bacterium]
MASNHHPSRRERQILDILFRREQATARDVWRDLGEDCSYSTIRKLLSILVDKKVVKQKKHGAALIYQPVLSRQKAGDTMMIHLVNTFFQGSIEQAISGLLGHSKLPLSDEQLQRIENLIAEAKQDPQN